MHHHAPHWAPPRNASSDGKLLAAALMLTILCGYGAALAYDLTHPTRGPSPGRPMPCGPDSTEPTNRAQSANH